MSFGSRVLVVDDEVQLMKIIKTCLTREGYRVLEATTGERGLQMALEEKPDLVILDVMLPGLDGVAVCAELRRLHFPAPVLMLTSKAEVEHRIRGLNTGAGDYLPKPFDHREFVARIGALLRRHHRHEQECCVFEFGGAHVDMVRRCAQRGANRLKLTNP